MNTNTAKTILEQLGGGRFVAMTGASNLIDLGDALTFKVGRNAKRVTHVKVLLTEADLYNVTFWRVTKRGLNVEELASVEGVFADMLRSVFTEETGLETSLGTLR